MALAGRIVSAEIRIVEQWRVVDRWWTDEPEERYFAVLEIAAEAHSDRVCVGYDSETDEWKLIPDLRHPRSGLSEGGGDE